MRVTQAAALDLAIRLGVPIESVSQPERKPRHQAPWTPGRERADIFESYSHARHNAHVGPVRNWDSL